MNEIEQKKIMGMKENDFNVLLHLSQLSAWLIPILGIVVPIILWLTQKDESEKVDMHGKNIANWIISYVIYTIISVILLLVLVGLILLPLLMMFNFIFIVVGAYKASKDEDWSYPFAIKFFK